MKVMAVIDVAAGARLEELRADLGAELRRSWSLFASGTLREAYATATPTRVVFVLECEDRAHAEQTLRSLPLIAAGQLVFELVELRPFVNWSLLFAP